MRITHKRDMGLWRIHIGYKPSNSLISFALKIFPGYTWLKTILQLGLTLFRKCINTRAVFDMIKHVQNNYIHYRNLYRIRYPNFRNDYAFAIAMHQMKVGNFIKTAMPMLADSVDVIDSDDDGVIFKYDDKVNFTSGQDLHIMDKEWCNG